MQLGEPQSTIVSFFSFPAITEDAIFFIWMWLSTASAT